MSLRRLHITPSMAVAVGAVIVALSGGAYAATTQSTKTMVACVHHSGGGLYVAHKCARGDASRRWQSPGRPDHRGRTARRDRKANRDHRDRKGSRGPRVVTRSSTATAGW